MLPLSYMKYALIAMLFCAPVLAKEESPSTPPLRKTVSATFYCTPDQGAEVESTWLGWIGKQKKTIHINAYGLTDADTATMLIDAQKRGVDVKLTMDSTEAATPKQSALVAKLKRDKIEVLVGKSPVRSQLLHAKLAIGDGKSVVLGSWNVSPSANEQFNDFLIVDDAAVARYYESFWQEIYAHLGGK